MAKPRALHFLHCFCLLCFFHHACVKEMKSRHGAAESKLREARGVLALRVPWFGWIYKRVQGDVFVAPLQEDRKWGSG